MKNGAIGMLYKWVSGPNNSYDKDFIYCFVGQKIVDDIFEGTGRTYKESVDKIYATKTPQSFKTGKSATIKSKTTHNPNAFGRNVVGIIHGSDPKLKDEYVIVMGHLDHLGKIPGLMAGANDNNSGTAIILGVTEAIAKSGAKPKRSILFIHTDGEESGLLGSTFYCNNPIVPKDKVVAVINIDSAGVGDAMGARSHISTRSEERRVGKGCGSTW